ncbi:MAG TPA: hypothetical protein VJA16_23985 [Thermoanaerobaculia bacterium]
MLAGSRGRRLPYLPAAVILCLCALAAMAQQPSATTGTTGHSKAGKERAKAGSAAAAAPQAAAPQPGTPAGPGAAAPSGSAGATGGRLPAASPASPGAPAIGSPAPDMGNIDQILEGDEEVLAGGSAFTYDPGNRRDPFKSLLIAPDRPEFRGPRPEGVPGLLIDEIDLKGIFRTARGYVAQVNASNQKKSYLLKEGDQLYDGDVMSIGKNEVVFKQIVQDPTALKPFREIVKSLNPGG